ncbi:hypothetical protein HQ520_11560, partial [bacterium]|nr:hypothetical protein [bacterium]
RFLTALHERRYPILTRLNKQYADTSRALALPDEIRIHPPRDFEGDRYRIEIQIHDPEGLRKAVTQLSASLENQPDAWHAIFNPSPAEEEE